MFENTVKLREESNTTEVVVIDAQGRRSLRASADGSIQLSIAHQESNENPGWTNQRTNVRITQKTILEGEDGTVEAYVQFTTSLPKEVVSAEAITQLTKMLICFLALGDNAAGAEALTSDTLIGVNRLVAGEP
jgi:hypothetical protein